MHGEAYPSAHQSAEAAAEFQKILDHRGIVVSDPIGALARLQLGRAYAVEGVLSRHGKEGGVKLPLPPEALAKAKAGYLDFLTLWKDADPDIPILQQAKAEYAKLQGAHHVFALLSRYRLRGGMIAYNCSDHETLRRTSLLGKAFCR